MRFFNFLRVFWNLFSRLFSRSRSASGQNGGGRDPAVPKEATAYRKSGQIWPKIASAIEQRRGQIFGGGRTPTQVVQGLLKKLPFKEVFDAVGTDNELIPFVLGFMLDRLLADVVPGDDAKGILRAVWTNHVTPTLSGMAGFNQATWDTQVDAWMNAGVTPMPAGTQPNPTYIFVTEQTSLSQLATDVQLAFTRTDALRRAAGGLQNQILALLGYDIAQEFATIPPAIMNRLAELIVQRGELLPDGTLAEAAYWWLYQTTMGLGEGEIEFGNQVKAALGRFAIWIMRDDAAPNQTAGTPRPFWKRMGEKLLVALGWIGAFVGVLVVVSAILGGLLYGGLGLLGVIAVALWGFLGNSHTSGVIVALVVLVVVEWVTLIPAMAFDRLTGWVDGLGDDTTREEEANIIRGHAIEVGLAFTAFSAVLGASLVVLPGAEAMVRILLLLVALGLGSAVALGWQWKPVRYLGGLVGMVFAILFVGLLGWQMLHLPVPGKPAGLAKVHQVEYTLHAPKNYDGSQVEVEVTRMNEEPFSNLPTDRVARRAWSAYVIQLPDGTFAHYTSPEDVGWYQMELVRCPKGTKAIRCFVARPNVLHGWFAWALMPKVHPRVGDIELAKECGAILPLEQVVPSAVPFGMVGLILLVVGLVARIVSSFLPEEKKSGLSKAAGAALLIGLLLLVLVTPVLYVFGSVEKLVRGDQPIERIIR